MKNLMKNPKTFFEQTKNNIRPWFITQQFLNLKIEPTKAIDLGCGTGRDTIGLIKNNWNVIAIDKENVEEFITDKLTTYEIENFKFIKQDFENLELPSVDLIVANYSLPFCHKKFFYKMWDNIQNHINQNGYFVGNFFGIKDSWNVSDSSCIFLRKEEVMQLFQNFEIIYFAEIEKNDKTAVGKMKHWHLFEIIAKK